MKKLLLASLALALLASCAKDDQGGIPPVDGTGQTNQNILSLEAATATATDYVVGKKVKLHGNIVIERNRPYFKFSDNTLVQIYAQNSVSNTLSEAAKTKLSTSGQEITVTGTFTNFTPRGSNEVIKEIVYTAESDLVFGTTPAQNQPQPSQGKIFDFEQITSSSNGYNITGTLQTTEGVRLSYKGRTNLKDDKNTNYAISGKGLMLTDHREKPYIKITFPNGVRKLFIDYKAAYNATQNRHFEIYEGDENSTQNIGEHSFAHNASGTFCIDLNKTGAFTLTIKPATGSKQFVLDNIKYEN